MADDSDSIEHLRAAFEKHFPEMRPWILGEDGRTPIQTDIVGYLEWIVQVGGPSVRVAYDDIGGTRVSTIFMDQLAMAGQKLRKPELFETMVFYGPEEAEEAEVRSRYGSWAEAEEGHAEIVASLMPRRSGSSAPQI